MFLAFVHPENSLSISSYTVYYMKTQMAFFAVEVLRNGEVVSNTNTYTPMKADRDGIQLKCRDTVHQKWRVEKDIVNYLDVTPYCKFVDSTIFCSILYLFFTTTNGSMQAF